MHTAIADPSERLASLIRAGRGHVEIVAVPGYPPAASFPIVFSCLHHGALVLGIESFAGQAELRAASARCELLDCVYQAELGPSGAGLLGSCQCGDRPGNLVRQIASVTGSIALPRLEAQRVLALEIAADVAHPELLAVGTEIRLLVMQPERIDLVDSSGVDGILPEELELAAPDPFCDIEAVWLARLNDPASGVMRKMLHNLRHEAQWQGGGQALPQTAVLTALDRFGVTMSALDLGGVRREWRIDFSTDCVTVADLGREIRRLCGMSAKPIGQEPVMARPLQDRYDDSRGA